MSQPSRREHIGQQVLSDEDLRDIIFWKSDVPAQELAPAFGVTTNTIRAVRKLTSYRHLRIAKEFGLVKTNAPRTAWHGRSARPVRALSGQVAVA